ncbi:MAG: hypothetical protein LH654_12655 [Thermoleophilia bacterium]|nr:hypothetical protein [Thermoleophilia bacterium]
MDASTLHVSVGSGAHRAVLAFTRRMANEAYGENRLDTMLVDQVSFAEIQALLAKETRRGDKQPNREYRFHGIKRRNGV